MKKGKSALAILLVLIMTLLLAGCGNAPGEEDTITPGPADEGTESPEVTGDTSDGAKLGLLAPTLQTELFIYIDSELKTNCENAGWEYTSVSFNGDSAAAVTAIENLVTADCDVIVAMVSDTSCDDALRAAQEAGVVIVECGVQTEVYDVCLNTNQYNMGVTISDMAADWIDDQLGGEANVVVYTTYQNADMQTRGQGIQDQIKERCPDVNILEVVDIGKDIAGAGTTTTETMMQKYPELNCLLCYGDAAAIESVEAVKAAGKASEDFGIFACDGTAGAMEYIASGDIMRGTIVIGIDTNAIIEYAQRVLDGETFPESIDFPITPVTSDNIADLLN